MADKHSAELPAFEKNLAKTNYIGEVGLDSSRDGRKNFPIQRNSFQTVLRKGGGNKVFSLHARMAEEQVLKMLLDADASQGIFHWFSGPPKILDKIIEAGYYFSINPRMCLTTKGQSIIARIPLDRLLTETDGPFAGQSGRPYYPWDVERVIEYLSQIHAIPPVPWGDRSGKTSKD